MKIFDQIKITRPKYNKFDLAHEKKISLNMGNLVPILCQEVVPGDKFKNNTEILARLAPMIAPMMHRVNVYTHFFFVPNRLVYDGWENFITGGTTGQVTDVLPYIAINDNTKVLMGLSSLADYLGVPDISQQGAITFNDVKINALPFRAYQKIFNEYYRDQTLTPEVQIKKTSGALDADESLAALTLRKRAWEKDYFTSALPWSQRGGEVLLPMEADINYKNSSDIIYSSNGLPSNTRQWLRAEADGKLETASDELANGTAARIENLESIENGTTTINDLRKAIKLQEWLERNARAGARYIEQILSHFGVRSSDARLQRPEYLGGGKQPIVVSEVLSTYGGTTAPQGNMSGHGISVGNSNYFQRTFEEHGYIIGIMSILPTTAYFQGLPRIFSKFDKFDYYWPEFAHLGEQEILQKELTWIPNVPGNDEVFGYQSRYAEYKFNPNTVHGDFRSSLKFWHMGREFVGFQNLNEQFITSDPTERIFAVEDPTIDKIYVQVYNNMSALRLMPYFGTPML
nr:MAG: major capsid protein [Microvirus sp.]